MVISAIASRPFLRRLSRHLRQTVFELWHVDLSNLGVGDGRLWRDVLAKAHLSARLSPFGRGNIFPDLEDVLISTPGDPKSAPLPELYLVFTPGTLERGSRLWPAFQPTREY